MEDIEQMAATIHRHRDEDHEKIRSMLAALRVPDAVEVLNAVPSLEEAAEVLTLMPLQRAIDVCDQPTLHRRGALLEQLPPELAAKVLDGMASDERTAAVREMCDHGRRLLLPLLSASARKEVEEQLKYPPHTAGELMATEFVRLVPTMTVGQALEKIREVARASRNHLCLLRRRAGNRSLARRGFSARSGHGRCCPAGQRGHAYEPRDGRRA